MSREEYKDYTITAEWMIDDGFVGNERHTTMYKPSDHLMYEEWMELSEDDKKDFIEEEVRLDFEEKVKFEITNNGL